MSVFELKMPKLGESVTEGTIGKWLKQPGEKVNKYDLLVEVQTDKVNTEIPSPVAGTLKEVRVEEGQTVPIGTLLATFDMADGDAAAASPASSQPTAATPAAAPSQPTPPPAAPSRPQPTPPQAASAPAQRPSSTSESVPPQPAQRPSSPAPSMSSPSASATATAERPDLSDVRATPAVRKLAAENGIDISQI